ncbi:MAG: TetR/AcrR family transcriptional regulator [Anaerovoracaceae bacterium]
MTEDSRREKRNRILDEAGKLFVRDGIDATKIIDIARASGVAKGTVYEYFDSKDEIVIEWIRSIVEDSRKSLQGLFDEELPTRRRLEIFMEHMLEQSSRIRVTAKILMDTRCTERLSKIPLATLSADSQNVNDIVEDKLISFVFNSIRFEIRFIKEILQKGIENGELKSGLNIDFVSYMIMSSIPFLSIGKNSVVPEDALALLAEKMGFETFDWESRDLCGLILDGIGA